MILRIDRDRALVPQLVQHFARAIRAGELHAGARLPATRRLAAAHRLARNTVVAAYQQLAVEGYVETHRAGGTRVASEVPRLAAAWPERTASSPPRSPRAALPGRISAEGKRLLRGGGVLAPLTVRERPGLRWDFQFNASVADAASQRAWSRIAARRVRTHEMRPPPWDPRHGVTELHEALAPFLWRTRGVRARPDQIVLMSAPQSVLRLAAQVLVEPGDEVAVEDPHFLGIRRAMEVRGARLLPVPSDSRGIRTDRLPRRGGPRLVYVTPSHGWPRGVSLAYARRLELLEWARRRRAWIIENDHNSETFFEGEPIEAVQGMDPDGRVIYTGTFSRVVEPHPSIAYAVVPDELIGLFHAGARLDGATFASLERETLAEFIAGGELEKLLRRASRRLRSLRRVLLAALRALPVPVEVRPASGGIHAYAEFPGWTPAELDRVVERAAAAGVGIYLGAPYFMRPPKSPGALFGFARLTEEEIRAGIARLGEVIADERPKGAA